MKITIEGSKDVSFENIIIGDTFKYNDEYFIKVSCSSSRNAIIVNDFSSVSFDEKDSVRKVESELIIKG